MANRPGSAPPLLAGPQAGGQIFIPLVPFAPLGVPPPPANALPNAGGPGAAPPPGNAPPNAAAQQAVPPPPVQQAANIVRPNPILPNAQQQLVPVYNVNRPPPIMGGVEHNGTPDAMFWTGGKPNAAWTALESRNPMYATPNCFRPFGGSASIKSWQYRTQKWEKPFQQNNDAFDITDYTLQVSAHLRDFGMDTIFWVPSEEDPKRMVNMIWDHAELSLEQVLEWVETTIALGLWDTFDRENDKAALAFLKGTLDSILLQKLALHERDTDTAAVYWDAAHADCAGRFHRPLHSNARRTQKALASLGAW
jgi:hypothetical protein